MAPCSRRSRHWGSGTSSRWPSPCCRLRCSAEYLQRGQAIRVGAGMLVLLFGVYKLIDRRHPRYLARIAPTRLAWWSFVMATAHGAGLMLVPVALGLCARADAVRTPARVDTLLRSDVATAVGGDRRAHAGDARCPASRSRGSSIAISACNSGARMVQPRRRVGREPCRRRRCQRRAGARGAILTTSRKDSIP